MILIQFQVTNTDSNELVLVPDFCKWLQKNIIYAYINNIENENKIKIRLEHLQQVNWIKWKNNKKIKLKYDTIIDLILNSITINKYKNNIYKIETNTNILIPNSYTSIDRIIRFINSGDNVMPATNIITQIQQKLNWGQLNALWKFYITNELGYYTDSVLVTQIA